MIAQERAMKKIILFAAMGLLAVAIWGQEQDLPPVQDQEPAQVQAAETPPAPQALPEGRDLKTIRFGRAFIHEGKEYPAGKYWVVLGEKDGQAVFFVANAKKEPLFEELAIAKPHPARGTPSHFHVDVSGMSGNEYLRIKVTTREQWLLGYFLVKK
jgi:hypothetical protein